NCARPPAGATAPAAPAAPPRPRYGVSGGATSRGGRRRKHAIQTDRRAGRGKHRQRRRTDLVLHGISAVVVDISQDILKRAQAAVLNNVRCVPLLSKTLPR